MECFIDEQISVRGARFQYVEASPRLGQLPPPCLSNPTTNMMSSAFHDKFAAMSLIQNKAHDSLLQKRQSLPVPPFSLACSAFAFRSSFVSGVGWFGFLSAEFQWTRRSRSFCRIKNNYFPVHIMYAELFTIIIPRRNTKNDTTWMNTDN
jgi:hypothetical protein